MAEPRVPTLLPDPFHHDACAMVPDQQVERFAEGGTTLEVAVRMLEASPDHRVLHRLRPRLPSAFRHPGPGERIALVLDTETTGLEHASDEVIELGMALIVHDQEGNILDVIGQFSAFREPSRPIPEKVTALTGITDAMVAGRSIDVGEVERFIAPADLVVAHNASFDREFCEHLARGFARKPWACSVREVDWSGLGFEGAKLGYLIAQCGLFHQGHRAIDDVLALIEVLARPLPVGAGTPFRHLLRASEKVQVRIWAERAPFDLKDALRQRGYRWNNGSNGDPKAWWIDVDEPAVEVEMRFLRREVYGWEVDLPTMNLTAVDRHRRR